MSNLDKKFREELGQFKMPVDTDAMWKNIEPRIDKKKKKPRIILLWWFVPALVLSLAVWQLDVLGNKKTDLRASDDVSKQLTSNGTALSDVAPVITANNAAKEKNLDNQVFTEAEAQNPNELALKSNAASQPVLKSRSPVIVVENYGATRIEPDVFTSDLNEFLVIKNGKQAIGAETQNSETTKNETDATSSALKVEAVVINKAAPLAKMSDNFFEATHVERVPAFVNYLPVHIKELVYPFSLNIASRVIPSADIDKLPIHSGRIYWPLLRADIGAGMLQKKLSSNVEALQSVLLQRQQTETALDYWQGNLMAGVQHVSGFYALSGISYTQLNERFHFNKNIVTFDTIQGIVETQQFASGEVVNIEGPVVMKTTDTYTYTIYNSYSLIDVPLVLGYQVNRRRWLFAAEGNVNFNLIFNKEGTILSADGANADIEASSNFARKAPINYGASLRLGYQLLPKMQITAAPSYRYIPNLGSGGFVQKYQMYGLHLTINYQL